MAEKTEQATPKKLKDARKKGQVAKAQDFPSAFTFIVSIASMLVSARYLYQILESYFISVFKSINKDLDLQQSAGGFLTQAVMMILQCSLPIMVITLLCGLLVGFLVVGPTFSMEAMKFDVKKLNPVTNIKNMFKLKTLIELLKSIFKITGAFILIYSVVYNSLPEIIATAGLPLLGITSVFSDFLVQVVIRVGIFFIIIAIFDLVFQKKNFAKEMKMEKFEVKQENKDTEGDPQVKNKRRQTAREMAYQDGTSGVKRAKMVVTNPVHLAIALEYDEKTEPAPKIITMGKGMIAELIIKAATEYHVPVMRNVPLAQLLWEKGEEGDYVPEEAYAAIAEILKWLKTIATTEEVIPELLQ